MCWCTTRVILQTRHNKIIGFICCLKITFAGCSVCDLIDISEKLCIWKDSGNIILLKFHIHTRASSSNDIQLYLKKLVSSANWDQTIANNNFEKYRNVTIWNELNNQFHGSNSI